MYFSYDPTTGDPNIGSVNLSSNNELDLSVSFESSWKIEGFVELEFTSTWNTGEGDYYWYRVEGSCGRVTCDTNGVDYPDCQNMKFLTVVAARNIAEVCELLSAPRYTPPFNFKLSKIEKYSRPVAKENIIEGECNIVEDQEFCQIAECLDYCIDESIVIYISLKPKAIESVYSHEMVGSISLLGSSEFSNYKEYSPNIDSSPCVFSGSSLFYIRFFIESAGSLEFSSDLNFSSNRYAHATTGSISIGGFSRNVSSSKNYTNSAKLTLGGSAKFCLDFYGSGGIQFDSTSLFFLRPRYRSSGIISLGGGLTGSISPSRKYIPSLSLSTTGSAYLNFSDLGLVRSTISLASSVFDLAFEAKESNYNSSLTIADAFVNPPCGCGPLGLSILLTHNMQNSSVLSNFLRRNGLSISDKVSLRYKIEDNSWRNVQHFRGISKDGFTFEDWTIFLTFQCQSELDAWRFSFIARSSNKTTKEDLYTKLILDIPASLICADSDVTTNIKTFIASKKSQVTRGQEIYVVSPPHSTATSSERTTTIVDGIFNDYSIYYDDLGLFKNSYWLYVPLEFNINPIYKPEMPTVDLQSIF